jgi:hypothetical protein
MTTKIICDYCGNDMTAIKQSGDNVVLAVEITDSTDGTINTIQPDLDSISCAISWLLQQQSLNAAQTSPISTTAYLFTATAAAQSVSTSQPAVT